MPIIRNHHERLDGRGYPDNLEEKDIPMAVRILTIADAFDAMTSDRPYRAALSVAEAVRRLRKDSGTQFDGQLVELFAKKVIPRLEMATV